MRIAILGINGYIGWSLALRLSALGHNVSGLDNDSRTKRVAHVGGISAIPIEPIDRRARILRNRYGVNMEHLDMLRLEDVMVFLKRNEPDTIIHLAEQPSAPYSMIDAFTAVETQNNNVIGSLNLLCAMRDFAPDAHLIKLGTMGEYGTPGVDIPEGFFDLEFRGRITRAAFPKKPGSIYHASKVMDTINLEMLCRLWSLRATDVMQGVVYGTRTGDMRNPEEATRFDIDECFGTVVNRFCAQAVIGMPLTVYGAGGQTRGYLSLSDSIQCLNLICKNPAEKGEYRVLNQLDELYDVKQLAQFVSNAAIKNYLKPQISAFTQNPRKEEERHYYKVDHEKLPQMGFKPTRRIQDELEIMIKDLLPYVDRIRSHQDCMVPKTSWQFGKREQPKPRAA